MSGDRLRYREATPVCALCALVDTLGRVTYSVLPVPGGHDGLGDNLYRLAIKLGYRCDVVAPSLIPRKAGAKIKTDRRDAMMLAQLLRAGQLTEVWVPDEAHEAMRDLVRMRAQAMKDLRMTR